MEQKIKKALTLGLLAFMLGNLVLNIHTAFAEEKSIRVAVLQNAKDFTLSVRGKFNIFSASESEKFFADSYLHATKVKAVNGGIKILNTIYPQEHIKIVPQKDAAISVNHRTFRGSVDIILTTQNKFLIVNTVALEDYIKGVLYHEVSHHWPLEAIKAQAVAARTYALYRAQLSQGKDYDVTNDIYSQVYGGETSEKYQTNLAVDKTKGLVIVYLSKILPAYYSATCAGATENVSELWSDDLSPLKGVVCRYCQSSPHIFWKKNFRLKDIQDKLNRNGFTLGLIKGIKVAERNDSNRIRTLEITTRDGKTSTISGKDFREIIGPNLVKSNNYVIDMKGYYVDLIGKGWGHGVGLCQWGAREMALQHANFEKILKYYYPGTEIVSYANLK